MKFLSSIFASLFLAVIPHAQASSPPPPPQDPQPPYAAMGVDATYLVFDDEFNDSTTIDTNATGNPGYNWYPQVWYGGGSSTPAANIVVSGGTLTLAGSLYSVVTHSGTGSGPLPYFYGQAFADNGGTGTAGPVYYEASIKFDPALGAGSTYWPSWWLEALEHVIDVKNAEASDQWPGQVAGYLHFMEIDIFEAYNSGEDYTSFPDYFATVTDWSGAYAGEFPNHIANDGPGGNNQCYPNGPSGSPPNWDTFHTYGALVVPQNGSTPGYLQYYFDNVPCQTIIFWIGPPGNPPLPGQSVNQWVSNNPYLAAATYSLIDQQHFVLTLSTSDTWPIVVDWVH
jgi:hypothetical protein